jgi:hypothetical protein
MHKVSYSLERGKTLLPAQSPAEKELYRILEVISQERTEQILKDILNKHSHNAKAETKGTLVCNWDYVTETTDKQ